jgi:hypothetical protein
MKKALIFILLLSGITGSVIAQKCTVKKGYAYERTTLSGTPPRKVMDESGNQVERPVKNKSTYFIYMEVNKNRQVQPVKIWIDGKAYSVTFEEINSPVIITYEQPRTTPDTLVRQTKNNILKIQPTAEQKDIPDAKVLQKTKKAKVVIEYTRNSKTYYHTIKDIKKLPPLVLQ